MTDQVEVSGEQETDEQERSHTLLDHHGEQQGQAVGGHDLGRNVKTSGQPLGNHVDDGLNQVGANKNGEEDRQEVHDGVQTGAGADVHTVGGLELSVIDRAICHMGEGGDDGTEDNAEELTQDGDPGMAIVMAVSAEASVRHAKARPRCRPGPYRAERQRRPAPGPWTRARRRHRRQGRWAHRPAADRRA